MSMGAHMANLNHIAEPLRHLAVAVSDLRPDPNNARRHDNKNLLAIKTSLTRFGQVEPIVVQKQGMIVRAGNGRLQVAKEMGWTHIAAVVVDQSDADAVAFAIADNRTAELGEWDYAALFQALKDTHADVTDLGFSEGDLAALETELCSAAFEDGADLEPTEVENPFAKQDPLKKVSAGKGDDPTIRRVMLYMTQQQYDELIEQFSIAEHELGTDNHSEIVLRVLRDRYGSADAS